MILIIPDIVKRDPRLLDLLVKIGEQTKSIHKSTVSFLILVSYTALPRLQLGLNSVKYLETQATLYLYQKAIKSLNLIIISFLEFCYKLL